MLELNFMEKASCRYCKREIQKDIKRCPYCGTLSPTVTIKEILKIIFIILFIMFIYSYLKK